MLSGPPRQVKFMTFWLGLTRFLSRKCHELTSLRRGKANKKYLIGVLETHPARRAFASGDWRR